MNDPNEDDLLPDHVETDTYLRVTHRSLTERLATELRLDDGLAAILHGDPSASEQDQASDRAAQSIAVMLISLRILAQASASASGDASYHTNLFINAQHDAIIRDNFHRAPDSDDRTHILDLLSERERAVSRLLPELVAEAADLSRTFAQALDYAVEHARDIDYAPSLAVAREHALEYARDIDYARYHARALARALNIGRGRDGTLSVSTASALNAAFSSAGRQIRALNSALDRMPVDASGADLSSIDLKDLNALEGVTWTDQTIWPSGIANRVRVNSVQIREGVYEVRLGHGGKAPAPSKVPV